MNPVAFGELLPSLTRAMVLLYLQSPISGLRWMDGRMKQIMRIVFYTCCCLLCVEKKSCAFPNYKFISCLYY